MELRPYQSEFVHDIRVALRSHRSVCAVLPTGGGKTVCFADMTQRALGNGHTVWIGMHRQELVEQTCDKLREFGVAHGVVQGQSPLLSSEVQVCMIQTLKNRLDRLQPPDIFIIDECHHAPASQYSDIITWLPPDAWVVGFTATPERLDGKGLGHHFDTMVQGPSVRSLIEQGYLVPPIVYEPPGAVDTSGLHTRYGEFVRAEAEALMDKAVITGDVIEHYRKYAGGLAAVAFCVSIAHAAHVAQQFRDADIAASCVDGTLSKDERRARLNAFRDGLIQVLTSADLISEGFDLPRIEAVILLRPTRSLALYLQQCGRALRPDDLRGKRRAIILDHVGNTMRFGGGPDVERAWSLLGRKAREKAEEDLDLKTRRCSNCFVVYSGTRCPMCRTESRSDGIGREIDQVDGELVQARPAVRYISRDEYELLMAAQSAEQLREICRDQEIDLELASKILRQRAKSLPDLRHVGILLGYKPGWAPTFYAARHGRGKLAQALEAEKEARNAGGRSEEGRPGGPYTESQYGAVQQSLRSGVGG